MERVHFDFDDAVKGLHRAPKSCNRGDTVSEFLSSINYRMDAVKVTMRRSDGTTESCRGHEVIPAGCTLVVSKGGLDGGDVYVAR